MSRLLTLLLTLGVFQAHSIVTRAARLPQVLDKAGCLAPIGMVERERRLPEQLLSAIANVESGRPDPVTGRFEPWPWAINVSGTSHFYASKEDAIDAVRLFQAAGVRSIDVGCMQINLLQHPNAFSSLDQAFDPYANVAYGAQFLAALYHQSGTWPEAIAAYHSQTPKIGADYWGRVLAHWTLADRVTNISRPLNGPVTVQAAADPNHTPEFAKLLHEMDEDHRRNMANAGVAQTEIAGNSRQHALPRARLASLN